MDMTNKSSTSTNGTNYNNCSQHIQNHQQQQQVSSKEHNHRHRMRPRSKDFDQSHESLDQLDDTAENKNSRYTRHHHHHHHHHYGHNHQRQRNTHQHHVSNHDEDERDDTEDNLADEEFEDDEVGRDVRKKRLAQSDMVNHHQQQQRGAYRSEDDLDDEEDEQHECGPEEALVGALSNGLYDNRSDLLKANVINDELKYGAGHHNHQSMDSNHLESQSEWSDDDCREEATGMFKNIKINPD